MMPNSIIDSIDAQSLRHEDAVRPNRTTGFSEEFFLKEFLRLVGAKKPEAAAKFLIEQLPALAKSGINRKEKLNHLLYLPRLIQASGSLKHGYQKVLNKVSGLENQISGLKLPGSGGFLELGCGAHDPTALSTYYYVNGFDVAHAVDMLPPRNPIYSALSMYDLLANMRVFPKRYCRENVLPSSVMSRLSKFPIGMFERGDFAGALKAVAGFIRYENCAIAESSIQDESLSLATSFAVLEHVDDLKGVCEKLYRALKPGGIGFHFIDMADHRSYSGDGKFHPLSFLTEEICPSNMNRLRAHEQLQAQIEAGFEIVKEERVNQVIDSELRSQILPRFLAMDEKDFSTIKMYVVVRKPGRQI